MENVDIEKTYYRYWGKWNKKDGSYHLLPYHCLDVAAVGFHILHPTTRRNQDLSRSTGISPELVQYLFVLILLLHDLGKFSTAFQGLIEPLFLKLFRAKKKKEYSERHDTVGFILWREVIKNEVKNRNQQLAEMLELIIKAGCGHHGIPPNLSAKGGNAILCCGSFFDQSDLAAASAFVQECFSLLPTAPSMPDLEKEQKQIFKYASWQFAGLSILADWVGSNIDFFPYNFERIPLAEYWNKIALPRAAKAVSTIGWHDRGIRPFNRIIDLFPFVKQPTPLQKHVAETELQPGPKLWVIEDVTGAGKTEAALILAQRMMGAGNADGIYLGLPTMATANAMYARLQKAYDKLYSEGERPSLVLSHGTRHLSKKFTDSIGVPKHHDDTSYGKEETASAYCNGWIADNRKKALLADVGVGTIDQALLSVLPARHQSLRMIGLHRKILIVDEVHAYDSYVEHLLGVLLEAHARNGGSAILLSATIPRNIRERLIGKFQSGLDGKPEEQTTAEEQTGFPMVTQVTANITITHEMKTRKEMARNLAVEFLHERGLVFEKILRESQEGQCVCWIRNTVEDARKAFHELIRRGVSSGKIDLFHSRFAMIDRTRIENAVVRYFGNGEDSEPADRIGRILIATQVVEQSLDLDFDQMITDIAPMDLLIQRAGRLHRHCRNKNGIPNKVPGVIDERAEPVLYIYGPEFSETPDKTWMSGDFKGSSAVYAHTGRLWLTQKILREKGGWSMPGDARALIESVYGDASEANIPDGLQQATIRAEGHVQAQTGMGHLNALILEKGYCRDAVRADQWDEDEKVQTRLTEESHEIALAVFRENVLTPYADFKEHDADFEKHAWDWSTLSVSRSAWNRVGYTTPLRYMAAIEDLKKKLPRLKYTEIVIATEHSTEAFSLNNAICNYYSPRYGWGASLDEEE
jgi:CRISPR-associated endonuclease/helicase Cas3